MKNCFGSLNYIFSPHSIAILKEIGLLPAGSTGHEKSGCMIHDVWFELPSRNFCVQFHEIINENEFEKNGKLSTVESISPKFIDEEILTNSSPMTFHNNFKLKGLIVEDILATREKIKLWQFPFEVKMVHPDENFFFKKLSYRKKFPFWCILLEAHEIPVINNQKVDVTIIDWNNQKSTWIKLETTSWDLLIYKGS